MILGNKMGEWKFIDEHNKALDFAKLIYWSDSFLKSTMLFYSVSPVSNQNNEIGIVNTDLLPNAWISILADTDDGYQTVEIVLSKVKVFSPPIFFDDAPEIILNDATLNANKEIKMKFSTISNSNIVCHEIATRTKSIDKFQDSSENFKPPKNWDVIDSIFRAAEIRA